MLAVYKMRGNVWGEAHHYMGVVRFQELKNRILYSEIESKNYILPIIAEHFVDRRNNLKLQKQLLPLRFRENMIEF